LPHQFNCCGSQLDPLNQPDVRLCYTPLTIFRSPKSEASPMIDAILFDLDETLLDRATTIDAFLYAQYQRYDLHPGCFALYRQRFHALDQQGYADKDQVFATLLTEFAIPATVQQLVADFRQGAWQQCHLFTDVRAVLSELRARGYQLGIITNGSVESQQAKLRATGLAAMVDVVLISAQEGIKKPDASIFLRAARRMGVDPSACLFVGDNPHTDIWGAYGAGFSSVWLKRALAWPCELPCIATHTIDELSELLVLKL